MELVVFILIAFVVTGAAIFWCGTQVRTIDTKRLDKIIGLLKTIKRKEFMMAKTLDEALAVVTEESTVADSLVVLTYQIKALLDEALAGVLTPEMQAKVDAIFEAAEAKKIAMAQAVLDNTPQAPTP